jgi:hypothetical protein
MAATENGYLRLKGDYEYNNGTPYREYVLLRDVPAIPATRIDVSPHHAIAGDVIRCDDDDELTPFELLRNGKRIGDPEWWMLRDLFDGLPSPLDTWAPKEEATTARGLLKSQQLVLESGTIVYPGWMFLREPEIKPLALYKAVPVRAGSFIGKYRRQVQNKWYDWQLWSEKGAEPQPIDERDAEAYIALDDLEREPRYDRARRVVAGLKHHGGAAFVEYDVLDLKKGDVIVRGRERPEIGGCVAPLTLTHYEALRARRDDEEGDAPLTELRPFTLPYATVDGFIRDRKTWGTRKRVWTPRLWRVRLPPRSPVSRPVVASSDVGAIFELLASVGGRMPAEGRGDA